MGTATIGAGVVPTASKSLAGRAWGKLRAVQASWDGRITDAVLGIDTAGPRLRPQRGERNTGYEPLPYEVLRRIARATPCTADETVVDLGCGKGRILCWFARRGVRLCRGVEIEADLAMDAQVNAERLRGAHAPIEVVCGDACEAAVDDATLLTLFNPFGAEIMAKVGVRIAESLARAPRRLRVVYANPVHLGVLAQGADLGVVTRVFAPYYNAHVEVVVLESLDPRNP